MAGPLFQRKRWNLNPSISQEVNNWAWGTGFAAVPRRSRERLDNHIHRAFSRCKLSRLAESCRDRRCQHRRGDIWGAFYNRFHDASY
jgi:hypothetical protein